MTKYFLFLLFVICFAQCTQTKKTKSGIEYQIIEAKHGKRLNSGDFIQIHFSCMTDYDSVVSSSLAVKKPLVLQLNSNHEASEINEALAELSVGDSAVIYPNALNFLNNTMRMTAIPSKIKQNSKLKFNVRILKMLSLDEIASMTKKEDELLSKKEKMLIEEYIQKEQITDRPSPTGLYYIEKQRGTGKKVTESSKLKLAYKGYFINGLSLGTNEEHGNIIELVLSEHKVIVGWEEGLLKMSKGTKAKLIVPSSLGYGAKGMKPSVPPFSTLIFEIAVIDVE